MAASAVASGAVAVIAPYYRVVRTTAKGRWYGKRLSEVAREFGPGTRLLGDPDRIVRDHDTVEYEVHVHEPPIPRIDLQDAVIHEGRRFVVVNKPSGIPVHPTVNYYQHSLTELLKPIFGELLPCYRLDRLTSGVLVLARDTDAVAEFLRSPKHKVYYARVAASSLPMELVSSSMLDLTDRIVTFNAKRGYARFLTSLAAAKPAHTRVRLIDDGAASGLATLQCEPLTGRTHQIRKHLALHGMPIHNDEVYADGGRFRRLATAPSEEHFAALWSASEANRAAKLTGELCAECSTPLYTSSISKLDLHCALYRFGEHEFTSAPPFSTQK